MDGFSPVSPRNAPGLENCPTPGAHDAPDVNDARPHHGAFLARAAGCPAFSGLPSECGLLLKLVPVTA